MGRDGDQIGEGVGFLQKGGGRDCAGHWSMEGKSEMSSLLTQVEAVILHSPALPCEQLKPEAELSSLALDILCVSCAWLRTLLFKRLALEILPTLARLSMPYLLTAGS